MLKPALKRLYLSTGIQDCKPHTWLGKINKVCRQFYLWQEAKSKKSNTSLVSDVETYPPEGNRLLCLPKSSSPSILILKLDHIGDFVVSVPAFIELKNAWPRSPIDIVCAANLAEFARRLGIFREIFTFDFFPPSEALGTHPNFKQSEPFPNLGHYNIAIDYRHDGETLALLKGINADFKGAFASPSDNIALQIALPRTEWSEKYPYKTRPLHAKDRLLLLSFAVISYFTPLEIPWASNTTSPSISPKKKYFGIGLGAGSSARKWPIEYYTELINEIFAMDSAIEFYLFGGTSDSQDAESLIKASSANINFSNFTGKLNIAETADRMLDLKFFIGADTGITHLAASLSIPSINIFSGVGNIPVWHGRGKNTLTIHANAPCSPCYIRKAEDCVRARPCIEQISVEFVLNIVKQFHIKQ